MDETHLKHLAVVLVNLNDATIDWGEVAKARGINRKDNAQASFKGMMKKHGVEYANNKFKFINSSPADDDDDDGQGNAVPRTPKKRKPKASSDDGEETKTPTASAAKKHKAKKNVEVATEKAEETADNYDAEI